MTKTKDDVQLDVIEGEDGLPSVNGRRTSSAKKGVALLFMLFILLAGAGFFYFGLIKKGRADEAKEAPKEEQVSNEMPPRTFELTPPAPPPEAAAAPAPDANTGHEDTDPAGAATEPPPKMRPQLDKSANSLMVDGAATAASNESGEAGEQAPQPQARTKRNALDELLETEPLDAARAGKLGNRNMLLTKGSMIECTLETRLDTTVPGMSSCLVSRDVYSDNGKVLLIERGSKAIGQYSSGLQQGSNRIFVLWTRVKTPTGVWIDLDSPGTDPLGASGLGGKVNNHFWKRFGAAMMLSLVDDLAASASRETNGNSTAISSSNSADAANDMAAKVLEQTVNIPPTLYKKHGDRINIFVARDLDFSSVYALRSR